MTLYDLAQWQIAVLGVLVIWLVTTGPRAARWGFAIGIVNLWAWFYVSYTTEAWGILFINFIYGARYVAGLRNYSRETMIK